MTNFNFFDMKYHIKNYTRHKIKIILLDEINVKLSKNYKLAGALSLNSL